MSKTRRRLAVVAALALAAGCSSPTAVDPAPPIEVADQVLGEHMTDAGMIAGMDISDASIILFDSHPVQSETVYPENDRAPKFDPAQPLAVRGADFPLDAALDLARSIIDGCGGFSSISIRALSAGVTTAQAACDGEADRAFLGADELEPIADPISAAAVAELWEEFATAGVDGAVRYVEIDGADAARAQIAFDGPTPQRTYSWYRALDGSGSTVSSQAALEDPAVDLQHFPAEHVGAALDAMLGTLEDPGRATRFELWPTDEGLRLVLEDAEYNTLAEDVLLP